MSTYSMFNQFAILTFTHLISHDLSHTQRTVSFIYLCITERLKTSIIIYLYTD